MKGLFRIGRVLEVAVSLKGCSKTFGTLSGFQRSIKSSSIALTKVLLSISDDFCTPVDPHRLTFVFSFFHDAVRAL